jgi:hypothetical protein
LLLFFKKEVFAFFLSAAFLVATNKIVPAPFLRALSEGIPMDLLSKDDFSQYVTKVDLAEMKYHVAKLLLGLICFQNLAIAMVLLIFAYCGSL